MNLIASLTLTAIINLELQALEILAMYKFKVCKFKTYLPLLRQIKKAQGDVTASYFQVYLSDVQVFDDVQLFDLDLPYMHEFVSAYCVIHCENNTLLEYASYDRAVFVCDAMGIGYSVICKYWIDGRYVYDDQVYVCEYRLSLSMLVLNVFSQFEIACIEMLVFYMGLVWDRYEYDWLDVEYIADAIFNYRHDRYKHFGFKIHVYDEYFDLPMFALTV